MVGTGVVPAEGTCARVEERRASLYLKTTEDNQHCGVLVTDKTNSPFRYHCS